MIIEKELDKYFGVGFQGTKTEDLSAEEGVLSSLESKVDLVIWVWLDMDNVWEYTLEVDAFVDNGNGADSLELSGFFDSDVGFPDVFVVGEAYAA